MKKTDVENIYPLSPLQEGMFFHAAKDSKTGAYHEQFRLGITGRVNPAAFEKAWQGLFNRHHILRTVFVQKNAPQPLQVLLRERKPVFAFEDLSGLPDEAVKARIEAVSDDDLARPFDLGRDVLTRLYLFKTGGNACRLIWSFHHIIHDGWSLGILLKELLALYMEAAHAVPAALPTPVPYVHYIRWLEGRDREASRAFWKSHLSGLSRATGVPRKRGEPQTAPYLPGEVEFSLGRELSSRLEGTAKNLGATVNEVARVLWAALLCRYNGTGEAAYLATVSGRPAGLAAADRIVGLFINAVPVRLSAGGGETFAALLGEARARQAQSEPHSHHSLAEIQALSPLRQKLSDHILVFENYPLDPESALGCDDFSFDAGSLTAYEHTHYDFEIQFLPRETLDVRLRYNRNLFDPAQIEAATRHLGLLASAFAQNPHQPPAKVEIVAPEEKTLLASFREKLPNGPTVADKAGKEVPIGVFGELSAPLGETGRWLWDGTLERAGTGEEREAALAKRGLLAEGKGTPLSLLMASTFVADPIGEWISWWGERFGIPVSVAHAPYNQVFQQLFDEESQLSKADGPRLLCLRLSDLKGGAEKDLERFLDGLNRFRASQVFVAFFPDKGEYAAAQKRWLDELSALPHVHALDLAGTGARFGVAEIFDPERERAGQIPFTEEYMAAAGTELFRAVSASRAHPFKVVAVDCDNTLWRGVCGDDGPLGVSVTPGAAALQKRLLLLREQGFLLVLATKNDPSNVWPVFEQNPGMLLKPEHFVGWRINWEPKSDNLRSLAEELNVGVDSFIFLDDSEHECAEVLARLPQVLTVKIPEDDGETAALLDAVWGFDRHSVTEEDRLRSELYLAEKERNTLRSGTSDLKLFLADLEIKVHAAHPTPGQYQRMAQLCQRANQFNLSTRRHDDAAIGRFAGEGEALAVTVSDRFGGYGLVGVILTRPDGEFLAVDTFILSCRVLGRGVEYALTAKLAKTAKERGFAAVAFDYLPSDRNAPILTFLETLEARQVEITGGKRFLPVDGAVTKDFGHISLLETPFEESTPEPAKTAPLPLPKEPLFAADQPKPLWAPEPAVLAGLSHRAHYQPFLLNTAAKLLEAKASAARCRPPFLPYAPPESEAEKELAALWEKLLELSPVGRDDDFFELGGHSLLATRLVAQLQRSRGVELDVAEVFSHRRLSELATLLDSGKTPGAGIEKVPDGSLYPCSDAQRRLWVYDRMEAGSVAYNMTMAYLFTGSFDPEAFRRSLEWLVSRHESLRTGIVEVDGEPMQRVAPPAPFPCEVEDLSGLPDPEEAARAVTVEEQSKPFNLSAPPLMRCRLLKLGGQKWVTALTLPHICTDGWSFSVIERELAARYSAEMGSGKAEEKPLPVQYRDYAAWLNGRLAKGELDASRNHWLAALSPPLPWTGIPPLVQRPPVKTFNGATVGWNAQESFNRAVEAVSAAAGATGFALVMAGLLATLNRYGAGDDLIVGFPVAGRTHADLADQVGFYANTLPLRARVERSDTFRRLLERVGQSVREALTHQEYPFDRLVNDLNLPRDPSRSPVFGVMLAYQKHGREANTLRGLTAQPFPHPVVFSQFDLTFIVQATDEGHRLEVNFNTDLYDEASARAILADVEAAVIEAAGGLDAPLSEMNLLSAQHLNRVVKEFNATAAPYPESETILSLFRECAASHPDATAIETDDESVTYAELSRDAANLSSLLIKSGLGGIEPVVGVCLPRGRALITAILGIFGAGAVYLPLDPEYPDARLSHMLSDSGCAVVLAKGGDKERFTALGAPRVIDPTAAKATPEPEHTPPPTPENAAYLIYTSGTTGMPKGVVIEHSSFVNMILAQIKGFGVLPGDRVLMAASPSFDASLSELFLGLLSGGAVVPVDSEVFRDPGELKEFLKRLNVAVATFTPAYLRTVDREVTKGLRVIISAGEPADSPVVCALSAQSRVFNAYGPTENAVCSTFHLVDPEKDLHRAVPVGGPIANTRAYVLDEHGRPAPVLAFGELCVAGVGLARHYLGDETRTKERFTSLPFGGGERIYRTGDRARWLPGGELEVAGRLDTQLKLRGHRVEAGEVEACLSSHTALRSAVVDLRAGPDGRPCLVAWYASKEAVPEADLKALAASRLPAVMRPSFYVRVETFPLTPNGKIDRNGLPDPVFEKAGVSPNRPLSPDERLVADAVKAILGMETLGMEANFFELGGTSLSAIRLAKRLGEAGLAVKVHDIYTSPTLGALAERASDRARSAVSPAKIEVS